MKYRVVFVERTGASGNRTEDPPELVDNDLVDGVILDRCFVERAEPGSLHVQEVMDEDDDFESMATEVWEYDIAEGREREFIEAMKNSKVVIDYEPLGDADLIEPGESAS
jgi:hypothetical protein